MPAPPGRAPASPTPAGSTRGTSARSASSRAARAAYAARPWLADYPPGVPADFAFPVVPLTRLLDDAAASFPDRAALVSGRTSTTYAALKDQVDRFATALAGLGVSRGDRVALVLPDCSQTVVALFAAWRLGAVVVQHDPASTPEQLRAGLRLSGARLVVCVDAASEVLAGVRLDTALEHVVLTGAADGSTRLARLRHRLAGDRRTPAADAQPPVLRFAALLAGTTVAARQVAVDPLVDLAVLGWTGGTTGAPRAAMLTHHNLVSSAYATRLWDSGATAGGEVVLGALPLYEVRGLTACLTSTVLVGGTLVLLPDLPDGVAGAARAARPTVLPGDPALFRRLGRPAADLGQPRVCVSFGSRLPEPVQERFEQVSGAVLVEGYGMAETCAATHLPPVAGERRGGSVGLPLPGTSCRIVDPEDGTRVVPPGRPGELTVAGPQVSRGYWGEPATRVLTRDGFLRTGDLAVMSADGWFTVLGRVADQVATAGGTVVPAEVEQVLLRLPEVADACVLGVPCSWSEQVGLGGQQVLVAHVVLEAGASLGEQDLVDACAQELATHEVPQQVVFREHLPRSRSGDVLRRELLTEEPAAPPAPAPVPVTRPRRPRVAPAPEAS